MNFSKIVLIFCSIVSNTFSLTAAEKPVKSKHHRKNAVSSFFMNNGAGPAEENIEMVECIKNKRRAQTVAAHSTGVQDDSMDDDWKKQDRSRVPQDKFKNQAATFPTFFITADGNYYKIPEVQWQEYARGEITWDDLVGWMIAIKVGHR